MSNERPLLSRAADAVYWMARYVERAENIARAIEVNFHLQLDLPGNGANQWQPLVEASGDAAVFRKRIGEATQASVIRFLASDTENPNSIFSCLRAARENARSIRETISSEMWEQINSMYLRMQDSGASSEGPLDFFRRIRLSSHMFQGLTDATMSHNEAWHFHCLGRQMERADKTSRILDVKYFMLLPSVDKVGTPYDDLHWSAVLKSVSGLEMYRKRHGRMAPREIVDFLVLDRHFPRSIRHSLCGADEALHAITGTPQGRFDCASEQAMGRLRSEFDFTAVDRVIAGGLHEYLDDFQARLNAVGDLLSGDFFTKRHAVQASGAAGFR
jgi:uncharacterized alpha-E superfamily protein